MAPARYPTLDLAWEKGATFLESVGTDGGPVSFSCELPAAEVRVDLLEPRSLVSVNLRFQDRDAEFHVHLRVVERREAAGGRWQLRLEFIDEELDRQELVLAAAEGDSVPFRRRWSRRVPCDLRVKVRLEDGSSHRASAVNISRGGALLALEAFPRLDTLADLVVAFPGRWRQFRVKGRIVSVISRGPARGVGVEFLFESSEQRDRLATLVAALERARRGD